MDQIMDMSSPKDLGRWLRLETIWLCKSLPSPVSMTPAVKDRVQKLASVASDLALNLSELYARPMDLQLWSMELRWLLQEGLTEREGDVRRLETLQLVAPLHYPCIPADVGSAFIKDLKTLHLLGLRLDPSFEFPANLHNLDNLGLQDIGPRTLASIGRLENLKDLSLSGFYAAEAIGSHWAGLTALTSLCCGDDPSSSFGTLTVDGNLHAISWPPNLLRLELRSDGCGQFPEDSLLLGLTRLTSLSLGFTFWGIQAPIDMHIPYTLSELASLEELALGALGARISFAHTVPRMTSLRALEIRGLGLSRLNSLPPGCSISFESWISEDVLESDDELGPDEGIEGEIELVNGGPPA